MHSAPCSAGSGPWAHGDCRPLCQVNLNTHFPIAGFSIVATTFLFVLLRVLAAGGSCVPLTGWRAVATVGALLLLCLMALFIGPTKLISSAFALATLFFALVRPAAFAVD